jgi:GAF domain-containing protein
VEREASVLVDDVHAFPGHIACDARSRSELVVPVCDATGALVAVLDIDSAHPDDFSADDVAGVEALVAWFARPRPPAPSHSPA